MGSSSIHKYLCQVFEHLHYFKYSFNINILDDARSFPSLWKVTQGYLNKYPNTLHQESSLQWILSDEPALFKDYTGGTLPWQLRGYNGCQFFSNFESMILFYNTRSKIINSLRYLDTVGDLNFFRSEKYMQYFEYLDKKGGFFYERWGMAKSEAQFQFVQVNRS